MKILSSLALVLAVQACSSVAPMVATTPDAGAGGQVASAGASGAGGEGSVGGAGSAGGAAGTGGKASAGAGGAGGAAAGAPGAGGQSATGGVAGAAGDPSTGGASGAGGAAVGPWGPMPRATCDLFDLSFANGTATVTSATSTDPSCSDAASLFVSSRSTLKVCMGVPVNYGATVISWSVASMESDANGNCDATIVIDGVHWTGNCVLTVTMDLLAQAPPKATADQPGPFAPPTCN